MSLARCVLPELLDELAAEDPRAIRSRRDLRRVNRLMGSHAILLRALDPLVTASASPRLVELGAGDGTAVLRLARSRAQRWPIVKALLVDQRPVVEPSTLGEIRELGWPVDVVATDALDWLARQPASHSDVVFANLFVHHFDNERLARLLNGIAAIAHAFVCCEPRRSHAVASASRLLGLIGCNDVSRHDAVRSVHAGFRDDELSHAWPNSTAAWVLYEKAAGLFSHLFAAKRVDR
jgi:hypothetical protein